MCSTVAAAAVETQLHFLRPLFTTETARAPRDFLENEMWKNYSPLNQHAPIRSMIVHMMHKMSKWLVLYIRRTAVAAGNSLCPLAFRLLVLAVRGGQDLDPRSYLIFVSIFSGERSVFINTRILFVLSLLWRCHGAIEDCVFAKPIILI